jgi:hypothetical protein
VLFGEGGDDLDAVEDVFQLLGSARLDGADHDVLAALFAAASFGEHALGFTDAGGVAEEDFEASATLAALVGLDETEQFFRIGTLSGGVRHLHRIPEVRALT